MEGVAALPPRPSHPGKRSGRRGRSARRLLRTETESRCEQNDAPRTSCPQAAQGVACDAVKRPRRHGGEAAPPGACYAPRRKAGASRMTLHERLARTPPGYRYTIGRILAIYSGLMVALLLAALDQTIVATALPKVVSDLGGITQYTWVFTAYMLGSTVTVPLYGKLGDVHGRKPLFIVAIVIFLVGSALCGAAQNMWELVVFRAVQGVGAGGLVAQRGVGPIRPFDLLRSQTVSSSVACMALVGAAMFGTISFVPLFVQGVIGTSATSSGVVLTPLILGAVTTSFISGQIVSRTGRYRPNTLIGPIILGAGMLLLWRMDVHTTNGEAARDMVIAGIGLGMMMQIFVLSVQNSVPRAAMGTATALTQFSRSIGATLGVTLLGVIVNQNLPSGLQTSGVAIHRLPPAGRAALANALQPAFLSAVFLCAVVFVISLFWVREAPLRTELEGLTVGDEASPQPGTRAAAR